MGRKRREIRTGGDADFSVVLISAGVLSPPRRHLPHSLSSRREEALEKALSDSQARIESPTAQKGCQGGRQGAEEGGQGVVVAREQYHASGCHQPFAADGGGGRGDGILLGFEQVRRILAQFDDRLTR